MSKHYSFKRASLAGTPQTPASRLPMVLLGIAIHCACLFAIFCIVGIASNSNIWPIAAALAAATVLPVPLITGLLAGWILEKRRPAIAMPILVLTGTAVAVAVIFIANIG